MLILRSARCYDQGYSGGWNMQLSWLENIKGDIFVFQPGNHMSRVARVVGAHCKNSTTQLNDIVKSKIAWFAWVFFVRIWNWHDQEIWKMGYVLNSIKATISLERIRWWLSNPYDQPIVSIWAKLPISTWIHLWEGYVTIAIRKKDQRMKLMLLYSDHVL